MITTTPRSKQQLWLLTILWLVGSFVAVLFATVLVDSAFVDGQFVPRTNDSFYHARRILDTALGPNGFYEFDARLHVPDGAWIPWPWGYDYLAAQALKAALVISPGIDPVGFLSYIPVVFVVVNLGLFVAALAQTDMRMSLIAAGVLAFTFSPLVQLMHSVGMIDHHFLEFTFVLLTIWLGLRWLHNPERPVSAALLGSALGISVAFHNGLFVLQLPLLATVFLLWMRDQLPEPKAIRSLAISLVVFTLAAALPSSALRRGEFDFSFLSWFHVYVAACTAIVTVFMAHTAFGLRRLWMLCGLCLLLAIPILQAALHGASFLSGKLSVLDEIMEVQSPWKMFFETWGPLQTVSFYSWLLLLVPVFLLYFLWRTTIATDRRRLYYSVWAVFGFGMLMLQYRLHYFGLFVLFTAPLVLIHELAQRQRWQGGIAALAALAVILVAYQPTRERLFIFYALGGEPEYDKTRDLYANLELLCDEDPGLVLADNDDGSPIIFHTECSVLSNNFIMSEADDRKIAEIETLMSGLPENILRHDPQIKYLFLRSRHFELQPDPTQAPYIDPRSPIGSALLISDTPPEGFEIVHSVYEGTEPGAPLRIYARLFRVSAISPEG